MFEASLDYNTFLCTQDLYKRGSGRDEGAESTIHSRAIIVQRKSIFCLQSDFYKFLQLININERRL